MTFKGLHKNPAIFLILLGFFLLISSFLKAQDTLVGEKKNDTIPGLNLSIQTFEFGKTAIANLPFKTVPDMSLGTPSAYYLKGKRMFYFGVEANGAAVFIDGMQVEDAGNFPLQSIGNYTFYGNKAPLFMGNALTGYTGIETRNPEEGWEFDIDAYTDLAKVMQTYTAEFSLGVSLA